MVIFTRTMSRVLFLAVTLFMLASCATRRPCPTVVDTAPMFAPNEVDAVLFLIGDAGEANPDGEPVLLALRYAVEEAVATHRAEKVFAVFLGDNLYPRGLPGTDHRRYAEYHRKLDAEIAVFSGVKELASDLKRPLAGFVPGNHDWGSSEAFQRIRNQTDYLEKHGFGILRMLPGNGCSGPSVIDVGTTLRVLAIDTQWWFRAKKKRGTGGDGCPTNHESEVAALIRNHLATAGERQVVVTGHHPFQTGGPHGDQMNRVRAFLNIPQDITGKPYRQMIASVTDAFATNPPIIYAAGHDHSLQLLRGKGFGYQVVSGSGSEENLTDVIGLDETEFCLSASGFARLDINHDGKTRLSFHVATGTPPTPKEVYATLISTR